MKRSFLAFFERVTPFLFILPAFLLFAGVVLLPSIGTTFCSFCEIRTGSTWQWVGLRNYSDAIFRDDIFHRALLNNFLYLLASWGESAVHGVFLAAT